MITPPDVQHAMDVAKTQSNVSPPLLFSDISLLCLSVRMMREIHQLSQVLFVVLLSLSVLCLLWCRLPTRRMPKLTCTILL